MLTSNDERLKGVLVYANSCCNPFARMPKHLKEIFVEALTFYNFFYEMSNRLDKEEEVMNKLFELLKYVGNLNSVQLKQAYIDEHWESLQLLAHELARARGA